MKRIAFISLTLTLLVSCEEFLEEYPVDSLVAEGFFTTPENIELGVLGTYNSLQDMYQNLVRNANERDDDFWFGTHGGQNENDLFEKTDISGFWDDSYATIRDANLMLESMEAIEFQDQAKKDQLKGELMFIRALSHFNLQNVYGPVPYVTETITQRETALEVGRTPQTEVLSNIEQQLNKAIPLLVAHEPNHRADQYAALALLADVNMHQQDWDGAIAPLKNIIDNGGFELVNIEDLFPVETNAGSIFEIQYNAGGDGTGSNYGLAHDRFISDWGYLFERTGGKNVPTWDIYTAYDTLSPRFKAFWSLGKRGVDSVAWTRKYEMQAGADNYRVYRLAEIYLLYAEALNEKNNGPTPEAYEAVNKVIRRAWGLPVDQPSAYDLPAGLSYEQFKNELFEEYRLELSGEAKRIFHLRRTGRFLEVMQHHFDTTPLPEFGNITLQPWMEYWPLPQDEINKNPSKIKQNPGWDQL